MPNARRAVQEAHERFTVGLLLDALNHRHRSNYLATPGPNPPDAIIQAGQKTSWIEVTTAYMNKEFAKDLNSYATEGEEHYDTSGTLFVDMDRQFTENLCSVVQDKLEKSTYETARDRFGPGYLAVSIQNPFFGRNDLPMLQKAWAKRKVADRGCFRSVYLIYRVFQGYEVSRWQHK